MNVALKPTILECCAALQLAAPVSHWQFARVVKAIAAAGLPCNVDGESWWYDYVHVCRCDRSEFADRHLLCPTCEVKAQRNARVKTQRQTRIAQGSRS